MPRSFRHPKTDKHSGGHAPQRSEREAEHAAYAPLLRARIVVVHAVDVLDMEYLENVVYAGHQLDIRPFLVHDMGKGLATAIRLHLAGEVEQSAVAGVLAKIRIVFAGERSPQHVAADVLAPFELADEGDAVQDFAVQVPRVHERSVAVVEELHVVDEVEGIVLHDVRQVGSRHDEQGEGHLVPLHAPLDIEVHLSPRGQPQAFVNAGLGKVVGIVCMAEVVETGGMVQAEDGSIVVGGNASLLGVDPGNAGLEAQKIGRASCRERV